MVRLQYDRNKQFKITLPKPLVLAKNWGKGDEIEFVIDDKGNIILKRKKVQHEKKKDGF